MHRPKISAYLAASVDGFIARADGAIEWLACVEREGEDYGYKAFFDSVDAIVVGRKTYEKVLAFDAWPYDGKRCVVLTRQTSMASRHGETFHHAGLTSSFEQLSAEGIEHVYVDGGTVIAQALASGLVDALTVSVIPILLGEGTPLAPNIGRDVALELEEHRAFASGLVQLRYRVARTGP